MGRSSTSRHRSAWCMNLHSRACPVTSAPQSVSALEIHRRKTMLISFSTLVLASQLIVTVADNVPKFNIERGCKVDSAASSLATGLDETIKRCVHDEQQAQDQLQTQWSEFAPSDKAMCASVT